MEFTVQCPNCKAALVVRGDPTEDIMTMDRDAFLNLITRRIEIDDEVQAFFEGTPITDVSISESQIALMIKSLNERRAMMVKMGYSDNDNEYHAVNDAISALIKIVEA